MMDKNKIKDLLSSKFVNEAKDEKPIGLKKTEDIKNQNKKVNNSSLKDVEKSLNDYTKTLDDNRTTNAKEIKKRELSKKEQDIHANQELFAGSMAALDYDLPIDEKFADRFKKSLAGDVTMGNSNEYANVVQDKVWGGDPNFGQSLVDKTKEMAQVQQNVVGGGNTMFPFGVKNGNYAINENNKDIKMKRLVFKKPFNGLDNALNLIPESYRVDDKEFEMTDGTETYRVRWEGTLTEGRAIIMNETNINLVNESIDKIKHLMGFKPAETLGVVKGKNRLDENKMFGDILNKTKSLLTESEEIEDQDAPEGEWDEETKKAGEATEHVEGSVSKEKNFPNTPSVKTGEWDKNVKGQAAEAKEHIHMNESWMYEEEMNEEDKTLKDVENFEKEDMKMLHKEDMNEENEVSGPLGAFATYLNKDFFQRLIGKVDNNRNLLASAFQIMLNEMLEQNPTLATNALKNDLKNIVFTTFDTIQSQNKNKTTAQADLANQAVGGNMNEEGDLYEMDRFDEIFDGLNEDDLYELENELDRSRSEMKRTGDYESRVNFEKEFNSKYNNQEINTNKGVFKFSHLQFRNNHGIYNIILTNNEFPKTTLTISYDKTDGYYVHDKGYDTFGKRYDILINNDSVNILKEMLKYNITNQAMGSNMN